MKFLKNNIVALIAIVIAIGGYFYPNVVKNVLGEIGTRFPNGVAAGTSGTMVKRVNVGTCNIYTLNTSIAAYGTTNVDCQAGTATQSPLTGVNVGDICHVGFATTTTANEGFLRISGTSASSTQGYITMRLTNASSTSYTIASTATSSLNYSCSGI